MFQSTGTHDQQPRRIDRRPWLNEAAQVTNEHLLYLNNAIADIRSEIERLGGDQGTINQVVAQHDDALTRLDDRVLACEQTLELSHHSPTSFGRGSNEPAFRTIADHAVDPRLIELDRGLRLIIEGAEIACRLGITGPALDRYIAFAAVTAETRCENEHTH